ncbi:hypothetical protein BSKO_00873 [Bryopsis sp. KO-2023]|nr:hypothetical protein BSKO_00873 [Bryopsis sp. KO-2023]
MYVRRVPTVVSFQQLESESTVAQPTIGNTPVGECLNKHLLKVSFAFQKDLHCSRVRSFGELRDLEDWEKGREAARAESVTSNDSEDLPSHLSFDPDQRSPLDTTLLALWDMCNDEGLFRYDVTACTTKAIPGAYGFIAQLNEGRATKKRPTEFRVDKVVQPFDDGKFNFNKAYMKEVLFQFNADAVGETTIDEEGLVTKDPHLVMINVSPIEYGHVLLVPSVLKRLPQLITPDTMLLALQFAAAVDNPYFRVGYNSLGAYATINHLHFQGYYLMAPYPVERAPTESTDCSKWNCAGVRVSRLAEYPVRGLVFEKTGSLEQMSDVLGRACVRLQQENIPHNLLISDCGARVFLWPQCYAEKQARGLVPEEILATGVNPAAFEIAGHMVLKARQDYEDITQRQAWKMLAEVSLDEDRFDDAIRICLE